MPPETIVLGIIGVSTFLFKSGTANKFEIQISIFGQIYTLLEYENIDEGGARRKYDQFFNELITGKKKIKIGWDGKKTAFEAVDG